MKLRQNEWGHDKFLAKYATAWQSFAVKVDSNFHTENVEGSDAITQLYLDTLSGNANAKALNVLNF